MTVVKQYRIWCNNENQWVYGWGEEEPTVCYNNKDHVINPNSVQELQELGDNIVQLKEENIPTGGNLCIETIVMDIPAGATGSITQKDHVIPIPINLINTFYTSRPENSNDFLCCDVGPKTTTGVLTIGTTINNAQIHVSPTVLDYLYLGYWCDITNGVTSHSLGRCLEIDKVNGIITVETPPPIYYPPGTYFQQTVRMIHNYQIVGSATIYLGANKVGSSFVPAGTTGRISYFNMDGKAKKFTFGLEYLY